MTNATQPGAADAGVLQDDLRDMLQALGMNDGAQAKSPHEVFQEALTEMKRRLAADAGAVAWLVEWDEGGDHVHQFHLNEEAARLVKWNVESYINKRENVAVTPLYASPTGRTPTLTSNGNAR